MKIRFEEIKKTKDSLEKVNIALINSIQSAPEKDRSDGFKLLDLIMENTWFGKIEYPIPPPEYKCCANIRDGVFHSMAIYIQFGKWRFTRTELNKSVTFGKKKNHEGTENNPE